jgi:hypothetical protein
MGSDFEACASSPRQVAGGTSASALRRSSPFVRLACVPFVAFVNPLRNSVTFLGYGMTVRPSTRQIARQDRLSMFSARCHDSTGESFNRGCHAYRLGPNQKIIARFGGAAGALATRRAPDLAGRALSSRHRRRRGSVSGWPTAGVEQRNQASLRREVDCRYCCAWRSSRRRWRDDRGHLFGSCESSCSSDAFPFVMLSAIATRSDGVKSGCPSIWEVRSDPHRSIIPSGKGPGAPT